jgi:hypothetical protein
VFEGEFYYSSGSDIYGFQFDTGGCTTDISGGDAEVAGFTVSGGDGSTVLGFSFSGSFIPAGDGTLVYLTGDYDQTCFSNFIFSGVGGLGLSSGWAVPADFCESGVFDCAGACDGSAVEDCAGVCGGDSSVDECGVCGGSGIADGACDCAGSVEDCAGECGGDASVDECGVCGGGGIADGACDCAGSVEDCAGECGGDSVEDCAGECGGSAVEDNCGECGGDGSSCTTETVAVSYNTSSDLYGFQFSVSGATVTGASGGAAADAGFTVSTANNTVLGFSFSGGFIPAGSGDLVVLEIEAGGDPCIGDALSIRP